MAMNDQMGDQLRFDDRVAVVTGAGRGIGRAHALALAARGAKVVVNDFGGSIDGDGSDGSDGDIGPAETVAREIRAASGDAVANGADVANPHAAGSLVNDGLRHFGRIDIIVANAGNLAMDSMPELELRQLTRHLDVHIIGSFNVVKAAWPHMTRQRYGRVVITSSVSLFGSPFMIAYATAKGGVMSLGRSLAVAGKDQGITVNLLAPVADTRMVTDPDLRKRAQLPALADGAELDPARGPELVTPMMLVLTSESCPVSGESLVAGVGRNARQFVAETRGLLDLDIGPEELLDRWNEVVDPAASKIHASTPDAVAFREQLVSEALRHAGRTSGGDIPTW
jgi:NAD(P)-dependent dehydrogenase (short-subunit alcohol dehydrogenase family)